MIRTLLIVSLQAAPVGAAVDAARVDAHIFEEASSSTAVVVDGVFRPELSRLGGLPKGVYVGGVAGAPAHAAQMLVRRDA